MSAWSGRTRSGCGPLDGALLRERDRLRAAGALDRPRFDYARQFAGAEHVVFAAPFWDMSFPTFLKVYIEDISVEGITFHTVETGLEGLCGGKKLILLTTRKLSTFSIIIIRALGFIRNADSFERVLKRKEFKLC